MEVVVGEGEGVVAGGGVVAGEEVVVAAAEVYSGAGEVVGGGCVDEGVDEVAGGGEEDADGMDEVADGMAEVADGMEEVAKGMGDVVALDGAQRLLRERLRTGWSMSRRGTTGLCLWSRTWRAMWGEAAAVEKRANAANARRERRGAMIPDKE